MELASEVDIEDDDVVDLMYRDVRSYGERVDVLWNLYSVVLYRRWWGKPDVRWLSGSSGR